MDDDVAALDVFDLLSDAPASVRTPHTWSESTAVGTVPELSRTTDARTQQRSDYQDGEISGVGPKSPRSQFAAQVRAFASITGLGEEADSAGWTKQPTARFRVDEPSSSEWSAAGDDVTPHPHTSFGDIVFENVRSARQRLEEPVRTATTEGASVKVDAPPSAGSRAAGQPPREHSPGDRVNLRMSLAGSRPVSACSYYSSASRLPPRRQPVPSSDHANQRRPTPNLAKNGSTGRPPSAASAATAASSFASATQMRPLSALGFHLRARNSVASPFLTTVLSSATAKRTNQAVGEPPKSSKSLARAAAVTQAMSVVTQCNRELRRESWWRRKDERSRLEETSRFQLSALQDIDVKAAARRLATRIERASTLDRLMRGFEACTAPGMPAVERLELLKQQAQLISEIEPTDAVFHGDLRESIRDFASRVHIERCRIERELHKDRRPPSAREPPDDPDDVYKSVVPPREFLDADGRIEDDCRFLADLIASSTTTPTGDGTNTGFQQPPSVMSSIVPAAAAIPRKLSATCQIAGSTSAVPAGRRYANFLSQKVPAAVAAPRPSALLRLQQAATDDTEPSPVTGPATRGRGRVPGQAASELLVRQSQRDDVAAGLLLDEGIRRIL